MKKKIILLLIIFISFTFFSLNINAMQSRKNYCVKLNCKEDIDFSNVSFEIINLDSVDSQENVMTYHFDSFGLKVFSCSLSLFKINLNLNSLPNGFGSDKMFYIIEDNLTNYFIFNIMKYDYYDVIDCDTTPSVVFKTNQGDELFVDYTLNVEYSVCTKTGIRANTIENAHLLNCKCNININNSFEIIEKNIDISYLDINEKLLKLYNLNIIFDEMFGNDRLDLSSYEYTIPISYIYNNRFIIRYDGDSSSDAYLTNSQINALGLKMTIIESYFNQYNFNTPNTYSNYFIVSMTYFTNTNLIGVFNHDDKSIYINMANWDWSIDTLCHEYFHAIQFSYAYTDPKSVSEMLADYSVVQYYLDNNLTISNDYNELYEIFITHSSPKTLDNYLYDNLINPYPYASFIIMTFISIEYCNNNGLYVLEDHYSNLQSDLTSYIASFNDILSYIGSGFYFEDMFENFVSKMYPARIIDSSLSELDTFQNGVYEKDSMIRVYGYGSYNNLYTIPAHGFFVFGITAPSNIFGKLNVSFSNIGSNIKLTGMTKTADLNYHSCSFINGNDGSKSITVSNFCSYEIVENNNEVITINFHICNSSNTSQSIRLNYYFDYMPHNNAIYKIKNYESEYYITSSTSSGNLYQYQSNSNLNQKWMLVYSNGSYSICLESDDDYHFTAQTENANSNVFLSNLYTYPYKFVFDYQDYYCYIYLYDNDAYSLRAYNLLPGAYDEPSIDDNGNIISYANYYGNLSMWILCK